MPEAFTPVTLRDLYASLSRENKDIFLKLIGALGSGREPMLMIGELPVKERWRFNSIVWGSLIQTTLPILIKRAIEIVKKNPGIVNEDEEFARELEADVKQFVEHERDVVSEMVRQKIKEERDPKPRFEERDAEIVRLRDIENKTFGEIGRLLLLKNPEWSGRDGQPMSRDAVEKAYHRRRDMPTK